MDKKPNSKVISYLLRRSFHEHLKAVEYASQDFLLYSLISLSFSISFRLYAQWYFLGNRVIPLMELIRKSNEHVYIKEVFDKLKASKINLSLISKNDIEQYLKDWEKIVVSGRIIK